MENKPTEFSSMPFGEFQMLTRKNKAGQDIVCPCHKLPPYPEQVEKRELGRPFLAVEMRRVPCSTSCLRATIIEKNDKLYWQQDCETNILQLELQEPREETSK